MTAVLQASGLTKQYGRRRALSDCNLSIPSGRIVGLVGPNGAGKTTLLQIAVGMLAPTSGSIEVIGRPPAADREQLAKVGYVAQETPTYSWLSIADHLRFGARTNPGWDAELAADRIAKLGLDPTQKAGKLSGGQRAQLALTLAVAKRPELLVLDEPVASLDPLARREFLQDLMGLVTEHTPTVVLSSHLLADIERICDHLIVVADGGIRLDGSVEELLATHKILTGPRRDPASMPGHQQVVQASHTDRQTTMLIRTSQPILDPRWIVSDVGLEDLVLAYLSTPNSAEQRQRLMAVPA